MRTESELELKVIVFVNRPSNYRDIIYELSMNFRILSCDPPQYEPKSSAEPDVT